MPVVCTVSFNTLRDRTISFTKKYRDRHDQMTTGVIASRLPYHPESLRLAQFVEKFSNAIYEKKTYASIEGDSKVFKGALFTVLANLENEVVQYNASLKSIAFPATPLKKTALYSLVLETLGIDSFGCVPNHEKIDYLQAFEDYFKGAVAPLGWSAQEIQKVLEDVGVAKSFLDLGNQEADATSSCLPVI